MENESSDLQPGVSWCGSSRCWDCGRMVDHHPQGGPQKFHWCRFRWLSRRVWREHQEGWHSGYRFAVENADDPMVLADADDYGTGWAGHMRVGHLTFIVGNDQGDEPPDPGFPSKKPGRRWFRSNPYQPGGDHA